MKTNVLHVNWENGEGNCYVTHLLITDSLSNNQHCLRVLLSVILLVVTTKQFIKQEGNIK